MAAVLALAWAGHDTASRAGNVPQAALWWHGIWQAQAGGMAWLAMLACINQVSAAIA